MPQRRPREQPAAYHAPVLDEPRSVASFGDMVRMPAQFVFAAIALGVADWAYLQKVGDHLALGPVRAVWIAGTMALIGIAMACWRLIGTL